MSGAVERRWGLRLGGALLLEDEGLHLLLDRLGRHLCPSAAKDCLSRTVEATKRERKRETDLWQPAAAAVWELGRRPEDSEEQDWLPQGDTDRGITLQGTRTTPAQQRPEVDATLGIALRAAGVTSALPSARAPPTIPAVRRLAMSTTVTHDDGTTIETNGAEVYRNVCFLASRWFVGGRCNVFLVDGKQSIENRTAHYSSLQSAVTLKFIFSGSRAMKSSRITFAASETKVSSVVGPWHTGKAVPLSSHVRPSSSYS